MPPRFTAITLVSFLCLVGVSCGSDPSNSNSQQKKNSALTHSVSTEMSVVERPNNENFVAVMSESTTNGETIFGLHVYGYRADSSNVVPLTNFGSQGKVSITLSRKPHKVIVYDRNVAVVWYQTASDGSVSHELQYVALQSGTAQNYRGFGSNGVVALNASELNLGQVIDIGIRVQQGTVNSAGRFTASAPQLVVLHRRAISGQRMMFLTGVTASGAIDSSFGSGGSGTATWSFVDENDYSGHLGEVFDAVKLQRFVDPGVQRRTSNNDSIAAVGLSTSCNTPTGASQTVRSCLVGMTSADPRFAGHVGAVDPRASVQQNVLWNSSNSTASIESARWSISGEHAVEVVVANSPVGVATETQVRALFDKNYFGTSQPTVTSGQVRKMFEHQGFIASDVVDSRQFQASLFVNNDLMMTLAMCNAPACSSEYETGTFVPLFGITTEQLATLTGSPSTTLPPVTTTSTPVTTTIVPSTSAVPMTTTSAVEVIPVFTVKVGGSISLSKMFKIVANGNKPKFVVDGTCRVVGTNLVMPANNRTKCTVYMKQLVGSTTTKQTVVVTSQ